MITDSFDIATRPIISLKDLYGEQKHLAEICIVTFSKVIYQTILETRECRQIAEIGACNGNIPIFSFREQGRDVAFYLSPIGSAVASECVLEADGCAACRSSSCSAPPAV